MGLKQMIVENFEPHKQNGEKVIAAYPAASENQSIAVFPIAMVSLINVVFDLPPLITLALILLAAVPLILFLVRFKNFTIIATDQRTVVGQSTKWRTTKVESVVRELPVDVTVGPTSGIVLHRTASLGEKMYVHRRFWGEVGRADAR